MELKYLNFVLNILILILIILIFILTFIRININIFINNNITICNEYTFLLYPNVKTS